VQRRRRDKSDRYRDQRCNTKRLIHNRNHAPT
jgi:hypothetical protein